MTFLYVENSKIRTPGVLNLDRLKVEDSFAGPRMPGREALYDGFHTIPQIPLCTQGGSNEEFRA